MNARGCNFDMLRQPITTHMFIHGFICAPYEYCLTLLGCHCMFPSLSVRMTRSSM